jgi:hypothetical protein
MKVALFYPPVGNACQPYLSTAALTAYLKQNGVQDAIQYDFNILATEALLSSERLQRAYRWCYHNLRKYPQPNGLSDLDAMRLQLSLGAMAQGPKIIQEINRAKRIFRTDSFYDAGKYQHALDTVRAAYQLISSRYYPSVINNQSFTMAYRLDDTNDILSAVYDESANFFYEILAEKLEDVFGSDGRPDIAGISIGYYEQLIPGLTLARLIKQYSPDTHVTVGGTMLSAFFKKKFKPVFFKIFDSIIFFEAEISFLKLIHAVSQKAGLDRVPNVAFLQDGQVVRTPITPARADLDALPAPDFTGFPLPKYLSPEPILPLAGSRGCYWRKCTFCTRQHFIDSFRQRSPQHIIEDMIHLHDRYGAKAFFFVDECVSPSILNALAEGIIDKKLDIRWSCYVRFEAKLADKTFCKKLSRSGLRMLYFGLESACQRIIDLMRKGNRKEKMAQILESTASAGILNMILYFVGFPSESRAEALETMTFLMDNRDFIAYALAGQFLLEESSPIFEAPEQFGITEVSPLSKNSDLGIIYNYKTDSGLSNQAATEIKDYINNETQVLHRLDFLNRGHLLLS